LSSVKKKRTPNAAATATDGTLAYGIVKSP
jgi:hypothetical protein